jgi:nucleoside-diphosphate-sugar epimerase
VRVFVAGATGAIGRPLVRLLLLSHRAVAAMTRDPTKAQTLVELGAEPVVCDAYDADGVREAVRLFAPDVVINELTEMPRSSDAIDSHVNVRMRTEGHRNLLDAAQAVGARYVVQSVAFPLHGAARAALDELERTTLAAGGVVLRYGIFWGPGTYGGDAVPQEPHVHVDEAARRTVDALEAPSGVIVVTDP